MPSVLNSLISVFALAALSACAGPKAPADYLRGQRLDRQKSYRQAAAAYAKAADAICPAAHRYCDQARLRHAEALESLGAWNEAESAYRALKETALDRKNGGRASFRIAAIAERQKKPTKLVLARYQQTILDFGDEVAAEDALRALIRLYRQNLDEPRLIKRLIALSARSERRGIADNLLYRAAEIYRRRGEDDEALKLYDRLIAGYRRSGLRDDCIWAAGQLLEKRGDFSGALRRYRKLLVERKDAYMVGSYNSVYLDDAQLRVALIELQKLKSQARAIEAFETLRDDFPHSILRDDAHFWLATIHLAAGKRKRACKELKTLLERYPDGNHARRARMKLGAIGC